MYTCPVCGYDKLAVPPVPATFEVCPSCGTEFGYDDVGASRAGLRLNWMLTGMPWFSVALPRPANWSPLAQLIRAGLLPVRQAPSAPRQALTSVGQSRGWRGANTTASTTTVFAAVA